MLEKLATTIKTAREGQHNVQMTMIAHGLKSVKMVNVFNAIMEIFAMLKDVQKTMIAQAMKYASEAIV